MSLLDDLSGSLEEQQQLSVKIDSTLQIIVDRIAKESVKFKEWYIHERHVRYQKDGYEEQGAFLGMIEESIKKKIEFAVTLESINSFLQGNNIAKLEKPIQEAFTSMLFQNVYDQGHNNFVFPILKTEDQKPIPCGYNCLSGTKADPISITMVDVVQHCCWGLKYANLKFLDNVGHGCAMNCSDSTIIFDDNGSGAYHAKNCDVYINGEINLNFGMCSKNSRFYSPHKKDLEQISKEIKVQNCSFYLIEDGKHKEVTFK